MLCPPFVYTPPDASPVSGFECHQIVAVRKAVLGYQHPLAVYDTLLMDAAA
jgi:hypothetical protein